MLPSKISLWKKEGSKWYRYNHSFKTSDNDSMMQASRLIRCGWTPYPETRKMSDSMRPLDVSIFDEVDTRPLDEAILAQTPLAKHIHHDWYERVSKPHREVTEKHPIEPIEESSQDTQDKVLAKAIDAYNRGVNQNLIIIKRSFSELHIDVL